MRNAMEAKAGIRQEDTWIYLHGLIFLIFKVT
jgi:hypothetical protein